MELELQLLNFKKERAKESLPTRAQDGKYLVHISHVKKKFSNDLLLYLQQCNLATYTQKRITALLG